MKILNDYIEIFQSYSGEQFMLLFAALVLLVVALNLYHAYAKNLKQIQQIKSVKDDLRALASASIGVGNRIRSIEKTQKKINARQDEVSLFEPVNQSYEQAIQLAKNGNSIADIVSLCGINQMEAELVFRMHHLDKTG